MESPRNSDEFVMASMYETLAARGRRQSSPRNLPTPGQSMKRPVYRNRVTASQVTVPVVRPTRLAGPGVACTNEQLCRSRSTREPRGRRGGSQLYEIDRSHERQMNFMYCCELATVLVHDNQDETLGRAQAVREAPEDRCDISGRIAYLPSRPHQFSQCNQRLKSPRDSSQTWTRGCSLTDRIRQTAQLQVGSLFQSSKHIISAPAR